MITVINNILFLNTACTCTHLHSVFSQNIMTLQCMSVAVVARTCTLLALSMKHRFTFVRANNAHQNNYMVAIIRLESYVLFIQNVVFTNPFLCSQPLYYTFLRSRTARRHWIISPHLLTRVLCTDILTGQIYLCPDECEVQPEIVQCLNVKVTGKGLA